MSNNKLSLQLNVDDFLPASDEEKESLTVLRKSVGFWQDGIRRLKKNKIAMVSLVVIIFVFIFSFLVPQFYPYSYEQQIRGSENLAPMQYSEKELEAKAAGESVFPEQSKPPTYNKRFSGYWANHYRAHMKEESLDKTQQKYATARIEIQVASVLMHAWSEVEHDLVYKPLSGTLSEEELAIIDELNGLVLAGEIALERLQSAGNERVRSKNATFGSQYELASYLYNYLSNNFRREDIELRMGNIELLFKLLSRLKMNGVKEIEPVLKSVKFEKDRRNISQQIIDQIITGNEKRYQIYRELRIAGETDEVASNAITYFFNQWVPLEHFLNRISHKSSPKTRGAFNINTLKRLDILDKECLNKIVALRKTRNVLIHNIETPEVDDLLEQGNEARDLLVKLAEQFSAPAAAAESAKQTN